MTEPDIELLARSLYDARSERSGPVSDVDWSRRKTLFPGTYRALISEAQRMVEEGEFQ